MVPVHLAFLDKFAIVFYLFHALFEDLLDLELVSRESLVLE